MNDCPEDQFFFFAKYPLSHFFPSYLANKSTPVGSLPVIWDRFTASRPPSEWFACSRYLPRVPSPFFGLVNLVNCSDWTVFVAWVAAANEIFTATRKQKKNGDRGCKFGNYSHFTWKPNWDIAGKELSHGAVVIHYAQITPPFEKTQMRLPTT